MVDLMVQHESTRWPDPAEFWRDRRVIVTGAGFPGASVVEKLRKRGAAEMIVPRQELYDLTRIEAVRQLLGVIARSVSRHCSKSSPA